MAVIPDPYPATGTYPDQTPAAEHSLTGTTGITYLAAQIANRDNAPVGIPVIGDSITEGMGATTFGARWIAQANRAIRQAYPTVVNGPNGGLGFIPIQGTGETSYTWPVTQTAGAVDGYDLGPVRFSTAMSAASTFTWTAPAGTTSVQIMYFDFGSAGSWTYQVGAGAPVTVTNGATAVNLVTAYIPITSGVVLTIAWVSGEAVVDGIIHYAGDEASGITFHGCGHYGWTTGYSDSPGGWQYPEWVGPGLDWAQCYGKLNPAALGIMLGGNDVRYYTAAQYQAQLETFIALLRAQAALASLPVLLLAEYQVESPSWVSGSWAPYVAAMRAVASATSNVAVIDLNYRMPPVIDNWQGNILYADIDHPSNLGHALVGEIIAAGIRIA